MQAISLVLLLVLYAISVEGFVDLFAPLLGIGYSPLQLSLLLSLIGIGLGVLFYTLSLLNQTVKRYIMLGVPGCILLMVVFTYLIFGVFALFELIVYLVKIGFGLMMCSLSLVGAYGLLKRQQNTILAAGAGILFFFFFAKILLGEFASTVEQIEILILFFILFVCYLELGTTSIYFASATHKMMPNKNADEIMLLRFNHVFSRYLVHIFIVLLICYVFSLIILQYSSLFVSLTGGEIMSINLESIYGMWLLVGVTVICAFLFWFLIPHEKTKNV